MEYNKENIEKLANDVVEGWDMGDLMAYAVYRLKEGYNNDINLFNNDVECMK